MGTFNAKAVVLSGKGGVRDSDTLSSTEAPDSHRGVFGVGGIR